MRKNFFILIFLIIVTGCKKSTKENVIQKISSTGELLCVYKEQRTNEDTLYTSYYLYEFNENGILKNVINNESIEFFNSEDDELKKKYKEDLEDIIKDYDDLEGISIKKNLDKDIYSFEVSIDVAKTDDNSKELFLLNIDRINLFKYYKSKGYTCE